jgi:sugar-phosphatase
LAPQGADTEADIHAVTQQEREDTDGIVEIAGARALLSSIPANRWAIVTSADEVLARNRIRAAGLPMPSVLVTADDVVDGKPSPDGYLLAAQRLGVAAKDCLIFEDAPAGVAAGTAAGARVIAVASRLMEGLLGNQAHIADWRAVSVRMDGEHLVLRIA